MGFNLKMVPLLVFAGAAAAVTKGVIDTQSWQFNGDALVDNLKTQWPVYLGIPILAGIGGAFVKASGFNPGVKFGKVSARLF